MSFCWNCNCDNCVSERDTVRLPMPYARCCWCADALPYAHKKPYCSTCEQQTRFNWETVVKQNARRISAEDYERMMREAQE